MNWSKLSLHLSPSLSSTSRQIFKRQRLTKMLGYGWKQFGEQRIPVIAAPLLILVLVVANLPRLPPKDEEVRASICDWSQTRCILTHFASAEKLFQPYRLGPFFNDYARSPVLLRLAGTLKNSSYFIAEWQAELPNQAWLTDAIDFFAVSLSVTRLSVDFDKNASKITQVSEGCSVGRRQRHLQCCHSPSPSLYCSAHSVPSSSVCYPIVLEESVSEQFKIGAERRC